MQEFLISLADVLEVEQVSPTDRFREVPMWSSLTGFAVIVMIEQRYGKQITAAELGTVNTVAELAQLAGVSAT